jgi:hypothetical protein
LVESGRPRFTGPDIGVDVFQADRSVPHARLAGSGLADLSSHLQDFRDVDATVIAASQAARDIPRPVFGALARPAGAGFEREIANRRQPVRLGVV